MNVPQYLAAVKTSTMCLHACLHALATGRTTNSAVPVKRKQWTLPMLATDCIFKVWNPKKTDTSMAFLATLLDSCDPSVAALLLVMTLETPKLNPIMLVLDAILYTWQ